MTKRMTPDEVAAYVLDDVPYPVDLWLEVQSYIVEAIGHWELQK